MTFLGKARQIEFKCNCKIGFDAVYKRNQSQECFESSTSFIIRYRININYIHVNHACADSVVVFWADLV